MIDQNDLQQLVILRQIEDMKFLQSSIAACSRIRNQQQPTYYFAQWTTYSSAVEPMAHRLILCDPSELANILQFV